MNKISNSGSLPDVPIIYEDEHLLVIDKPHGLLSQADHTGDTDVATLAKKYLQQKKESGSMPYVGLVHRLDRPVGGLMLLAKTSKAAAKLSDQIRDRTIRKTYHAIVQGSPPPNGFLTHHLQKNREKNIVEVVSSAAGTSKEAQLSFQRKQQSGNLALLAVHLQTGRPHQIRVQLAEEGYPVWGDYKYGLQQPDGRTMALRAVDLLLNHPVQNREMHFTCPPPDEEPWLQFELQFSSH